MTTEQTGVLALKDQEGNYYLLSQEALEQARVPRAQEAEVERLIAESANARLIEGDDVQGHVVQLVLGAAACIVWGVAIGIVGASTNDLGKPSPPTDPKRLQQGSPVSRPL